MRRLVAAVSNYHNRDNEDSTEDIMLEMLRKKAGLADLPRLSANILDTDDFKAIFPKLTFTDEQKLWMKGCGNSLGFSKSSFTQTAI